MQLGGPLDPIQREVSEFVQQKLDNQILPQVRAEAAKGAEDAVKPLVLGTMIVAGVSLLFSIVAIMRATTPKG